MRRIAICRILLAALVALASAARAAEPEPRIRTHLEAPKEWWVGQKAALVVDLLAPGYFSGNPSFDLPQVPGLILMLPEDRPTLSTEEVEGVSYTVQRHELSVYPARPGERKIPAFTVRFGYKPTPLAKDATPAKLEIPSVVIAPKLPPGAEKLGLVISARQFEVTDQWTPEPGKARVGDALQRVITMTAPEVPSMIFPPFRTSPVDGLGIYSKAPEVLDTSERGSMTGRRREVFSYVCQRAGQFIVPAARLTWWDLDAKKLRTVDFARQVITVAANPAIATKEARRSPLEWLRSPETRRAGLGLLLAAGAAAILWKFRRALASMLDYWRPRHLEPLNPPETCETLLKTE